MPAIIPVAKKEDAKKDDAKKDDTVPLDTISAGIPFSRTMHFGMHAKDKPDEPPKGAWFVPEKKKAEDKKA